MAAEVCELEEFQGILNWANESLTREEVIKLLLATDNEGRTVIHVAGKYNTKEKFQRILNWGKENLTREEANKFLLATDNKGSTIFNVAG